MGTMVGTGARLSKPGALSPFPHPEHAPWNNSLKHLVGNGAYFRMELWNSMCEWRRWTE
jgi:hypothetical protein